MAYTYPQMPLLANVWYAPPVVPPPGGPDAILNISLSPIHPEDFLQQTPSATFFPTTHIIRTAPNSRIGDNYHFAGLDNLLPATVFECPQGSEHFYVAMWYHECGAGFANHHARIYVARQNFDIETPLPRYRGWI